MSRFTKTILTLFSFVIAAVTFSGCLLVISGALSVKSEFVCESERVIFIKDAENEKQLTGDGSGRDENNPLIPVDHKNYEANEQFPKNYLQTSFYQATEKLKDSGGTVVICGPVYFGIDQSYGSDPYSRDVFTAEFKHNTIKFTSVYNGVDYRKTNDARIIIDSPAHIGVNGQSVWENIDIETRATNRIMSFNYYSTVIGNGVRCYYNNPDIDSHEGYLSLSGGHRYLGGVNVSTNLVVKSGTYNIISAGSWGENNERKYIKDGDNTSKVESTNNMDGFCVANLVCEGTTIVYGQIIGTTRQYAEFSGDTNVTINSGKYMCDINMIGESGMSSTDGKAVLTINGGDFSKCWSINDTVIGHKNYKPLYSHLDFSGFVGEISEIADAVSVTTFFTMITYPEGITHEDVLSSINTKETTAVESTETDCPSTENGVVDKYSEDVPDDYNKGIWVIVIISIPSCGFVIGVCISAFIKKCKK